LLPISSRIKWQTPYSCCKRLRGINNIVSQRCMSSRQEFLKIGVLVLYTAAVCGIGYYQGRRDERGFWRDKERIQAVENKARDIEARGWAEARKKPDANG
jgi:hypothetical protein